MKQLEQGRGIGPHPAALLSEWPLNNQNTGHLSQHTVRSRIGNEEREGGMTTFSQTTAPRLTQEKGRVRYFLSASK